MPKADHSAAAGESPTFAIDLKLDDTQLASCIACGLCLPHCPTYRVTNEEYASPRGRLALMSAVNQSASASQSFVEHMEMCVLCLGCETACPAGVPFGQLMEQTREALVDIKRQGQRRKEPAGRKGKGRRRGAVQAGRWQRWSFRLLAHPRLLRLSFVLLGVAQRLGIVRLAQRIGIASHVKLPKIPLWQRSLKRAKSAHAGDRETGHGQVVHGDTREQTVQGQEARWEAASEERETASEETALTAETVWLFTGCVMDAMMRHVHLAAQTAVEAVGGQVVLPGAGASCCGALHRHAGLRSQAEKLAFRTMSAMPGSAPILVDSAGCGAALKDYGSLLATQEAEAFSARVQDIHEWLATKLADGQAGNLGGNGQGGAGRAGSQEAAGQDGSGQESAGQGGAGRGKTEKNSTKVAVLDPCHLRHAQKTHQSVRQVLQTSQTLLPHIELVELDDEGLCCGAGGAYSLTHPETAAAIGQRKQEAILRSGAQVVVAANPGCLLHLQEDLQSHKIRICHPIELLSEKVAGRTYAGRT